MASASIFSVSPSDSTKRADDVQIIAFSELDKKAQDAALTAIADINSKTSTRPGWSWDIYTDMLLGRLEVFPKSDQTLFVAMEKGSVIGYSAFYEHRSELTATHCLAKDRKALYCSWIAMAPEHRRRGIGTRLHTVIFDHGYEELQADVKKTNQASIRSYENLTGRGFHVIKKLYGSQYHFTVTKPSTEEG